MHIMPSSRQDIFTSNYRVGDNNLNSIRQDNISTISHTTNPITKSIVSTFNCKFDNPEAEGEFSGYASIFGNIDCEGDIIEKGAFKDSLQSGRKIKLLWQHKVDKPIGIITEAKEDNIGLFIKGRLIMEVKEAKEARALLKEGAIDSFSIGFIINDCEVDSKECTRVIKSADLYEVSIVTFPANPQAKLLSMKSATPYKDLPLAPSDTKWDSSAAVMRVRDFTDSMDNPSNKYKDAFFWYDAEKPELFGSYKLPYADVIDGKLMAVPHAIHAAYGVMHGARGGVDIPQADRDGVMRNIEKYRKKIQDETSGKNYDLNLTLKFLEKELVNLGLSKQEALDFVVKCKRISNSLSDSGKDILVNILHKNNPAMSDSSKKQTSNDFIITDEMITSLKIKLLK